MKRLLVLFVCAMAGPAHATAAEDACIVAAATQLPAIPDMKIETSATEPSKDGKAYTVKIAAIAAGRHMTFGFVCGIRDDGSAKAIYLGPAR